MAIRTAGPTYRYCHPLRRRQHAVHTVALIGLHDVRNLTAKVDHRDQREMIWRSTMTAGSPAFIVRRGVN
jgi:hypothetical protein